MKKRHAFVGLSLFLAVAMAPPVSAQSLEEVIANHVEAVGGEEAWMALETVRSEGTLSVMGGMVDGPFTVVQMRPAMFRFDLSIQGMDIIQAYDGETAWQVNPPAGVMSREAASDAESEAIIANADLDGPFIGETEGMEMELLGTEAVDGSDAYKIQVTINDIESTYFIDAESYQIVRVDSSAAGVFQSAMMSEYRVIDGLTFAFVVDINAGGMTQSLLFDSIETNIEIDEAQFSIDSPND